MIYWPAKRPGAVLDYRFDWSAALAEGETLVAANVTATGVTIDAQSHDATGVTLKVSGGTLGVPGVLVCSVTTNSVPARTDEETAILPIGEEPISLDMAKKQLRLEGTTIDDDHVLMLATAARAYVEDYCGIKLAPVAAAMSFAHFGELEALDLAPIQSIAQVTYLDTAGVEQVLDPSVYELVKVASDPLRPQIRRKVGQQWPATRRDAADAVRVSAIAGYTVPPQPLLLVMLQLITQWYDNRTPVSVGQQVYELPNTAAALLANYRR
jgi:uncharacterized phiE125 gp8 family phage protein